MKKKFLLSLLGLFALPAMAATTGENFTYKGIVYTVLSSEEKTASTVEGDENVGYTDNSYLTGDVVIPETVQDEEGNEYTVTEIADSSFSAGELTSISIPKTVTNIGYLAFAYCDNLVAIYNYSGYPQESYYQGYAYSLSANYAFDETTTENITVYVAENAVSTYTGWGGYSWKAIQPIEGYTFDYPNLEEGERFNYGGICYEVVSTTDLTCQTAATTWNNDYPQDSYLSGNINIPATVVANGKNYSVIGIGEGSFTYAGYYSRNGFSLTLPETIQYIDDSAFSNAKITSIEIDATSLTNIVSFAFYQVSNLKSVVFTGTPGDGVELSIGEGAFEYCSNLASINLPASLTTLGNYAFAYDNSLASIVLPKNLTTLEGTASSPDRSYAFYMKGTTPVTKYIVISPSLTTIPKYTFGYMQQLEAIYNLSITPQELASSSFYYMNEANDKPVDSPILYVPLNALETYTSGEDFPYFFNKIEVLTIEEDDITYTLLDSDNVSLTGYQNTAENNIIIPNNVEWNGYIFNVGEVAAEAIDGLSVTIESPIPPTVTGTFTNLNSDAVLYVPAEAVESYMAADGWKEFSKIRPIGYEVPVDEDSFTVSPADGDAVAELATLTISSSFTDLKGQGSSITINNNATDVTTSNNQNGELVITLSSPITGEGEYAVVIPAGFFTYVYENFEEDSPELSLTIKVDSTVGVEEINVSTLRNAEYYNLNGVRVDHRNLNPGIYVVRQGEKTFKVVVR